MITIKNISTNADIDGLDIVAEVNGENKYLFVKLFECQERPECTTIYGDDISVSEEAELLRVLKDENTRSDLQATHYGVHGWKRSVLHVQGYRKEVLVFIDANDPRRSRVFAAESAESDWAEVTLAERATNTPLRRALQKTLSLDL